MKTYLLAAASVLAVTMAAGAAQAQITTAGSIAVVSDYRLRGVSLTEKEPALQGSLELGYEISPSFSIYAGGWLSSLDKDAAGGFGSLETDLYVGVKGKVSDFAWSAKYLRLLYTDGVGDFDQWAADVSYPFGPVGGTLGVVYDDYGPGGDSTFVYASAGYTIPETPFSIKVGVGYEDGSIYNGKTNYSIGATYTYKKMAFTAEYIDTDVTVNGPTAADLGGGAGVFTISSSF